MSLTTDGAKGLILSTTAMPRFVPLDTVLAGKGRVMALRSDWWMVDWSLGTDLFLLDGTVVPHESGWYLERKDAIKSYFLSPATKTEREMVSRGRICIDTGRPAYAQQLNYLAAALDEDFQESLKEWKATIEARPVIDPSEALRLMATAERDIGVVPLMVDGVITDALAIDEMGQAATAAGDSWLESIGSQWMGKPSESRPELVEFLAWVADQTVYGEATLGAPYILVGGGTLDFVASSLVRSTVPA